MQHQASNAKFRVFDTSYSKLVSSSKETIQFNYYNENVIVKYISKEEA